MPTQETLAEELKIYEAHKLEWLRLHSGKFVVIVGHEVIGFHRDYESGFKAGLAAAGLGKNFLLKQVSREEPVYLIC